MIVNKTGTAFSATLEIAPSGGFDIQSATSVRFARTPADGETWTVTIAIPQPGDPDIILTYDRPVTVTDTLDAIATEFAAAINADVDAADFVATAEGDVLAIISLSETEFSVSVSVADSAGDPVVVGADDFSTNDAIVMAVTPVGTRLAGEEWKLNITFLDPEGTPQVLEYSRSAAGGESSATVAGWFAADIADDVDAGDFVATVVDATLFIVSLTDNLFSVGFSVATAYAPVTETSAAAADSVVVQLTGYAVFGDTWIVALDNLATTFSVIVNPLVHETLADIDRATELFDYAPSFNIEDGIVSQWEWIKSFYA